MSKFRKILDNWSAKYNINGVVEVLIQNEVIDDAIEGKYIGDYLNKCDADVSRYRFVNCCFNAAATLYLLPRENVIFENCTFIDHAKMIGGRLTFNGCIFKRKVWFEKARISAKDCTFAHDALAGSVEVSDCGNSDLVSFMNCDIYRITFYNHCSTINLHDCRINHIDFERGCYFSVTIDEIKDLERISMYYGFFNIVHLRSFVNTIEVKNCVFDEFFNIGAQLKSVEIGNFLSYNCVFRGAVKYFEHSSVKNIATEDTIGLLPSKHDLILYKKCKYYIAAQDKWSQIIVKLEVPNSAERVYCAGYKIRVSEAKTLAYYSIEAPHNEIHLNAGDKVISQWDPEYEYVIGRLQRPRHDYYDASGRCGSGIHGYTTFEHAVDYSFM